MKQDRFNRVCTDAYNKIVNDFRGIAKITCKQENRETFWTFRVPVSKYPNVNKIKFTIENNIGNQNLVTNIKKNFDGEAGRLQFIEAVDGNENTLGIYYGGNIYVNDIHPGLGRLRGRIAILEDAGITNEIVKRFTGVMNYFRPKGDTPTPLPLPLPLPLPPENSLMSLNTILYGPPGTGKTYTTAELVTQIAHPDSKYTGAESWAEFKKLSTRKDDEACAQVEFVTFHPSYAYEDFVEGIRPNLASGTLSYVQHDGIFKRICARAYNHPNEPHVLVIDEINRGNIARIFGELITLIEDSKRWRSHLVEAELRDPAEGHAEELEVTLPTSQKRFCVPANLYIIGTMNTADKSIALVDIALRRRFHFVEMMPRPDLVAESLPEDQGRIPLRAIFTSINRRISETIGRDFQIGHAFLQKTKGLEDVAIAFQQKILPLLCEYFHHDPALIRRVLFGEQNSGPSCWLVGANGSNRFYVPGQLMSALPRDEAEWQAFAGELSAIHNQPSQA